MKTTRRNFWMLIATFASLAASAGPLQAATFRSRNFVVTASTQQIAQQVGEYAEQYRKEKAQEWLNTELPPWPRPCTIDVKVTFGGAGGATSFDFDNGVIRMQQMHVEGRLDRILDSVLPHEITHTIFAAKFRRPLPRWADEGGSVLSEDFEEKKRHDLLVREIINSGRMIPLARLFVLTEYPRDVMALYAQGFSVSNYLVSLKDRPAFLEFVNEGQTTDWNSALNRHYGVASVEELQKRWIAWLIAGRGTGADELTAAASVPATRRAAVPTTNARRVVRGQMPEEGDDRPGETARTQVAASEPRSIPSARPRLLPTPPAPSNVPPPPPKPTPVMNALASAASPDDRSDAGRELIPIAVGRARRQHSPQD